MNDSLVQRFLSTLRRRCSVVLKLATASLFLILLGHSNPAFAQTAASAPDILAAYNSAIYDSAVYKFSNLRPLYPMKFDPKTKTATVVTLTNYNYTDEKGNNKTPFQTNVGNYYVWVTIVPEVQDVCRGFSSDNLNLRLHQLLGLHPNSPFTHFVVMTVTDVQIFRPTANPDPTTSLPCSTTNGLIPANCGEVFPKENADLNKHKVWLANQMLSSYVISESHLIPVGYPWTRLGYTYDWKPGANKYGASEYIIKPNSVVTIKEITPYQDYCQPTS